MMSDQILGYLAATLTTVAFIPQSYHSWKTRDLSGISLPMYTLFTLGVACWLFYGININSKPVIIANAVTCFFSSVIWILKVSQVFKELSKKH
jgi:MtN3 and saliva related transmembrane protein